MDKTLLQWSGHVQQSEHPVVDNIVTLNLEGCRRKRIPKEMWNQPVKKCYLAHLMQFANVCKLSSCLKSRKIISNLIQTVRLSMSIHSRFNHTSPPLGDTV